MYRLAADFFNDAAMVLDFLSPVFPKPMRVGLLSLSSVLRALCGVAAGSSKASLSAHFAKWGNLAELNAVWFIPGWPLTLREKKLIQRIERFKPGNRHIAYGNAGKKTSYLLYSIHPLTSQRNRSGA